MRALVMFVVTGCAAHPIDHVGAPPLAWLAPVGSTIAGCRGATNDVSVDALPLDDHAPLVVLSEYHMHGYSPPTPALAIWADGSVLFERQRGDVDELAATTIASERASALAHDVAELIRDVPRYTDVWHGSGGTMFVLTVHDRSTWRTVAVYGDDTERLRAIAHGTAKPPASESASRSGSVSTGRSIAAVLAAVNRQSPLGLDERPWSPTGFAKAYALLVESPRRGPPARPYDYEIRIVTPERGDASIPTVPWPSDLPPLPADLTLARCDYEHAGATDGCHVALPASYRDAAERFTQQLAMKRVTLGRTSYSKHPTAVGGIPYWVSFEPRYRGRRTIDAIEECGASLRAPEGPHAP